MAAHQAAHPGHRRAYAHDIGAMAPHAGNEGVGRDVRAQHHGRIARSAQKLAHHPQPDRVQLARRCREHDLVGPPACATRVTSRCKARTRSEHLAREMLVGHRHLSSLPQLPHQPEGRGDDLIVDLCRAEVRLQRLADRNLGRHLVARDKRGCIHPRQRADSRRSPLAAGDSFSRWPIASSDPPYTRDRAPSRPSRAAATCTTRRRPPRPG